jgi:hypothetical protein
MSLAAVNAALSVLRTWHKYGALNWRFLQFRRAISRITVREDVETVCLPATFSLPTALLVEEELQ